MRKTDNCKPEELCRKTNVTLKYSAFVNGEMQYEAEEVELSENKLHTIKFELCSIAEFTANDFEGLVVTYKITPRFLLFYCLLFSFLSYHSFFIRPFLISFSISYVCVFLHFTPSIPYSLYIKGCSTQYLAYKSTV